MFVGGLFEIVLGFILVLNLSISAVTLPVVLGFWLLMRSFSTIGLGGDMISFGIPGAGWTLFTGILLMLCSVWILMQPLVFGTTAVLVWVGVSLLFAGAGACSMAFQLRHAHRVLGEQLRSCGDNGGRAFCKGCPSAVLAWTVFAYRG